MIDSYLRDLVVEAVRVAIREELRTLHVERAAAPELGGSPLRTDEMLTVAEGAKEAKTSGKTIRAACAAGAIKAHKPAGCAEWRFTRGALLAWLSPSTTAGAALVPVDSDAGPVQAVAKLLRGAAR